MNAVQKMKATWKAARTKRVAGRLDAKLRGKLNRALSSDRRTNGNLPHRRAQDGYSAAMDILTPFGIQVDEAVSNFEFEKALNGSVRITLAFANEADPFSPDSIQNSLLVVSYAPFGNSGNSGDRTKTKFEVVAYIS